jgi:Mrp family chromosome partitioning ATPase/DUF971 family protein
VAAAAPHAAARPSPLARPGLFSSPAAAAPRGASVAARATKAPKKPADVASKEGEVLKQLEQIMDPDFAMNIVECGFVKHLEIDEKAGAVSFAIELTTPACPVKDEFEQQARELVSALPWVKSLNVKMTAQPAKPLTPENGRPQGLSKVQHIIAVSSCKGGVGKSTVAVNLAYTLAQMGAKVGIFDADVYGPSLPTMVNPEVRVLEMNAETKAIYPVEYEGVKLVSFGFAGQGSAIMRGPMVSGVIQQLLTTAEWGELDYLVVDFPPGTGDIQLTLCQSVQFSAAVIVTTPQKLAFIDVAKGIRMFAKLMVPCVAVVENMSYFEVEGKKYHPFGVGSGDRIVKDYALPNLIRMPIVPDLSACGDGGKPLVVEQPTSQTAKGFMELGAAVVMEVAKLKKAPKNTVRYDRGLRCFVVKLPNSNDGEAFMLDAATVRRNDTSAASINEWTGQRMLRDEDIPDDIEPQGISPLGNYAVQITWADGFNQVAPFDLLDSLPRADYPEGAMPEEEEEEEDSAGLSNAMKILKDAEKA